MSSDQTGPLGAATWAGLTPVADAEGKPWLPVDQVANVIRRLGAAVAEGCDGDTAARAWLEAFDGKADSLVWAATVHDAKRRHPSARPSRRPMEGSVTERRADPDAPMAAVLAFPSRRG